MKKSLNLIKISTKSNKCISVIHIVKAVLICFAVIFFVSCIKLKGEFALKFPMQDVFHRVSGNIEINSKDKVDWLFKFDTVPADQRAIGIFIMKKEVIWVEVFSRVDEIGKGTESVDGTFHDFPEGNYQLIITDARENTKIDSLDFMVYSDED